MKIKDLLELEKNEERVCQWQNLIGFYIKMSRGEIQLKKEMEVFRHQQKAIDKARSLFQKGWPVAYITGHCFFYETDFLINKSVFIPRPETEILVERAVDRLARISHKPSTAASATKPHGIHRLQDQSQRNIQVMDIGSGSGCLGLSIARKCPQTRVWLLEGDFRAFELSKTNAQRLSLENVNFECVRVGEKLFGPSDWKNRFDLILANPPYIAHGDPRVSPWVHAFEPHQALYTGENGLHWIHKWLEWGYDFLKEDGLFVFEFGQGQGSAISSWLKKSPYRVKEWIDDYSGIQRFVELGK